MEREAWSNDGVTAAVNNISYTGPTTAPDPNFVAPKRSFTKLSKLQNFKLISLLHKHFPNKKLTCSCKNAAIVISTDLGVNVSDSQIRYNCLAIGFELYRAKNAKQKEEPGDLKEIVGVQNNHEARLEKIESFLEHGFGKEFTSFLVE